jgi:hypothetical protein
MNPLAIGALIDNSPCANGLGNLGAVHWSVNMHWTTKGFGWRRLSFLSNPSAIGRFVVFPK